MYSVFDYGRMADDRVRIDAYCRAIERTVKPGAVVLDLGCGTGILSMLAIRAGARRVHAVDPSPAIWLVPELASACGAADRVVVHHKSSLEMDPPEPIDVVISDLRGVSPFLGDHLPAIRDVRRRWLQSSGVLVPERDRVHVALVEARSLAADLESSWLAFERLGVPAAAAKRSILNSLHREGAAFIHASDVVSTSGAWADIDYRTQTATNFSGTVELEATRGALADGLVLWFETTLTDGIGFTTAPGHALVYGRHYLPLLERVPITPGDRATVTVRVDQRGERWAWDTTISDREGSPRAAYRQATFLGEPSSAAALLRGSSKHRPILSDRGLRLSRALAAMDGASTIEEIAATLARDLPEGSPARDAIVEEVRRAAERYAR